KGTKLPITEQHRKNLFIRQIKKGKYMGQTGIASILIATEKVNTGGKEVDRRLCKELVATTAFVSLFQRFNERFGRFRSICKGIKILPLQGVYPSALFGFIEVDNVETVILAPTVLFGKQVMIIGNFAEIGVFQIVKAHGERIGQHLAYDRHDDPKRFSTARNPAKKQAPKNIFN